MSTTAQAVSHLLQSIAKTPLRVCPTRPLLQLPTTTTMLIVICQSQSTRHRPTTTTTTIIIIMIRKVKPMIKTRHHRRRANQRRLVHVAAIVVVQRPMSPPPPTPTPTAVRRTLRLIEPRVLTKLNSHWCFLMAVRCSSDVLHSKLLLRFVLIYPLTTMVWFKCLYLFFV